MKVCRMSGFSSLFPDRRVVDFRQRERRLDYLIHREKRPLPFSKSLVEQPGREQIKLLWH